MTMFLILITLFVLKSIATWLSRADTIRKSVEFTQLQAQPVAVEEEIDTQPETAQEPVRQPKTLHRPAMYPKAV